MYYFVDLIAFGVKNQDSQVYVVEQGCGEGGKGARGLLASLGADGRAGQVQ